MILMDRILREFSLYCDIDIPCGAKNILCLQPCLRIVDMRSSVHTTIWDLTIFAQFRRVMVAHLGNSYSQTYNQFI